LIKFYLTNSVFLFLVFMCTHSKCVYLTVDDLFSDETCPASFPLTNLPTYASAAEALEEYFK